MKKYFSIFIFVCFSCSESSEHAQEKNNSSPSIQITWKGTRVYSKKVSYSVYREFNVQFLIGIKNNTESPLLINSSDSTFSLVNDDGVTCLSCSVDNRYEYLIKSNADSVYIIDFVREFRRGSDQSFAELLNRIDESYVYYSNKTYSPDAKVEFLKLKSCIILKDSEYWLEIDGDLLMELDSLMVEISDPNGE